MKPRITIYILVAAVILLVICLLTHRKLPPAINSTSKLEITTNVVTPTKISPLNIITNNNLSAEPPRSASSVEMGAWERAMDKKDPYWEYKLPISFYGKVQDDQGQPIAGANVGFVWADLSDAGTSKSTTQSDGNGLFSLTGATGKGLSVYVSEDGYQRYHSKSVNRTSFEYSPLGYPSMYYKPDSNNPVIFVMRKNREAETLEARENMEAKLQPGESKSFVIGPNGASVLVERLPNENTNSRTWNAVVSVPNGGLQITAEEFPFEAPTNGYEPSLVITNETPKPPTWPYGWGAMLYVQTPQGYGRVKIHYMPNNSWIYVDSWFNPNPASRNLEPDPSKMEVVKP